MAWSGEMTTTLSRRMVQQLVELHVLSVEPGRGVGERVGVPVVTLFVLDRETGAAQVRADRPEHIGRVEGLHPLAPVAAWRLAVTVQSDGAVGAAQEPRRDAEVLEHRDGGGGGAAGRQHHLVPGRVKTAHLLDHSVADGALFVEQGAVEVQSDEPRGIVNGRPDFGRALSRQRR